MGKRGWKRKTERELGSVQERLRATENADVALRAEMRDGFDKSGRALTDGLRTVGESVAREGAHMRGEINRLDALLTENRRADEAAAKKREQAEQKAKEDLIRQLKEQVAEGQAKSQAAIKSGRPFVALAAFIVIVAQLIFENLPSIVHVMENMR